MSKKKWWHARVNEGDSTSEGQRPCQSTAMSTRQRTSHRWESLACDGGSGGGRRSGGGVGGDDDGGGGGGGDDDDRRQW